MTATQTTLQTGAICAYSQKMSGTEKKIERKDDAILASLSARQRQALDIAMAPGGMPTKAIAREMGIAPATVDKHLAAARDKLGAPDQKAAIRKYARLRGTTENPVYENPSLPEPAPLTQNPHQDLEVPPASSLAVLDRRFGIGWRIFAVFLFFVLLLIGLVAAIAILEQASSLVSSLST